MPAPSVLRTVNKLCNVGNQFTVMNEPPNDENVNNQLSSYLFIIVRLLGMLHQIFFFFNIFNYFLMSLLI